MKPIWFLAILVLIVASCSPANTDITDVLRRNVQAANDEDVSTYMATMHPHSPVYASTETTMRQLIAVYYLSIQMESATVVESSADETSVSVVLVTRLVSGPTFRDNRVTATMILRRYDGEWRLYDQVINDIKYLN